MVYGSSRRCLVTRVFDSSQSLFTQIPRVQVPNIQILSKLLYSTAYKTPILNPRAYLLGPLHPSDFAPQPIYRNLLKRAWSQTQARRMAPLVECRLLFHPVPVVPWWYTKSQEQRRPKSACFRVFWFWCSGCKGVGLAVQAVRIV